MKVTAPQMGLLNVLLEDLLKRLDVEFIQAPPSNEKPLEIGSRLGPELVCLPLKITLGNLIEGIERGADTIVTAGGFGPCRFGYYGQIQRLIMERAGYKFNTITIEPPTRGISKFIAGFKELSPGKSTLKLYS
ncbi:MAG: CoA protein activase, partial [Actinobacteria bacterium]